MALSSTPRTWTTGETVTAAMMNAEVRDALTGLQSAWASYIPTLTGSVTNPTMGNAALSGHYHRVGKTINLTMSLVLGTTFVVGSGTWSFTLPVTAVSGVVAYGVGVAYAGAGGVQTAICTTATSTTMNIYVPTATTATTITVLGSGGVSGTAWTLTTASLLRVSLTYEAA